MDEVEDMEALRAMLESLGLLGLLTGEGGYAPILTEEEKASVFDGEPPSVEAIARRLSANEFEHVVVVVGAGLSVSAGVPDFRSPSGLYAALAESGQDLPEPEAVFDIEFFRANPTPFFALARALMPPDSDPAGEEEEGGPSPTRAHYFLKLLETMGVLQRVYSQNIDGLELSAGLDPELLIQVHGSFHTATCTLCGKTFEDEAMGRVKETIMEGSIPVCTAEDCLGVVKPDIVFFGESLPEVFFEMSPHDMEAADLVIVMGTSLTVAPVSSLPSRVPPTIPRLLINREVVGDFQTGQDNYRDVCALGDLDDVVGELVALVGEPWESEFADLVANVRDRVCESDVRSVAQSLAATVAAVSSDPSPSPNDNH